jgi:hypothetical protein
MAKCALVIGTANYDNFTNLPKAVNAAEAIAFIAKELRGSVQEPIRMGFGEGCLFYPRFTLGNYEVSHHKYLIEVDLFQIQ